MKQMLKRNKVPAPTEVIKRKRKRQRLQEEVEEEEEEGEEEASVEDEKEDEEESNEAKEVDAEETERDPLNGETEWNNLLLEAVESMEIEAYTIKERQRVCVIDREPKTQSLKIYHGVVARRAKSANPHNRGEEWWDVELEKEKHSFAYPYWSIFKTRTVARAVLAKIAEIRLPL